MIKNLFFILVIGVAAWVYFHHPHANWQGQLAPKDPDQSSDQLPSSWIYKDYTVTPRAKYHIKAVVLSENFFWGGEPEDDLSKYDLALGWGVMSDAAVLNQLNITQAFRWYHYTWKNNPPIDPNEIISHSSNHHIIAANQDVLDLVGHFKRYDVVDLTGYLVDVLNFRNNWSWHTSVSRFDTGGGACKLFWVTSAYSE